MRAPELIAHEERMRSAVRLSPSPGKFMPGYGHQKSASTITLVSPGKAAMAPPPGHSKTISVSNPPNPSTTPEGSPKRYFDGPLSASKSKLQSIMKTAKGLFTSSAGVSAAAKMETLTPNALRSAANNVPGLYPNLNGMNADKPLPSSPTKDVRKTRSSTEKEKEEKRREEEAKALQKMDDQLQRAREQEKQKVAQFKKAQDKAITGRPNQPLRSSPRRQPEEQKAVDPVEETHETAPLPALPQQSKLSRPTKPNIASKARPQPVSIRVGTLSQRMPITTSALASNLQETLPAAEPRRPGLVKKASNTSMTSTAPTTGFKASVGSQPAKPRSIMLADRKREQDEREAQRRLEQKREQERKKAAQQEEARKQEQRQRQEAERKERERIAAEQAKRAAQQQAIEKKRLESAKRLEHQRTEHAAHEVSRTAARVMEELIISRPRWLHHGLLRDWAPLKL